MPRPCTVCARPDREEIDQLLCELPIRVVSGQCGVPKSSLARHKQTHLPAALVLASDREAERQRSLFVEAQAIRRSISGWSGVSSRSEWLDVVAQAEADYESGKFLLDRLGAVRYLDPGELATLLRLRRRIIAEMGLASGLELMLLDVAIIAYATALRVQGWIGDLSLLVEHDLFGDEGPTMKVSRTNGRYRGLQAEDDAKRLRDDLLPALDRANKTFVSAIRALREFRAADVNVTIRQAAQVNVAEKQIVGMMSPSAA